MIKINFFCIGTLKEKYLQEMSKEYLKRLSKFAKVEIKEFKEVPFKEKLNDEIISQVKTKEGTPILGQIKNEDYVILLDLHGKTFSSEEFACKFLNITSNLRGNIDVVIGGALGVSDELVERADLRFKISDLTFTHQFTRIITLEQIYRAFKINNNEQYHH